MSIKSIVFQLSTSTLKYIFIGSNCVIISTWSHGKTYDLNIFRLKTLKPSYSASVYSILCEKGKLLTDIAGYGNGSLLTLQGTEMSSY